MSDPSPGELLLVEDDAVFGGLLERHLRGRGFTVERLETAEAALERLRVGPRPGLVLLDINLPGDTGWDLLRSADYADAGRPPVVVLTATAVSGDRLRDAGAAGYLPKPFPLETLVAIVERFVGQPKERASR